MKDEVLIIGCGEIGTALIDGWLNKSKIFFKKVSQINIVDKSLKRKLVLKKKYKNKINIIDQNKLNNLKKNFKYVFLAFKPKDLNFSLDLYKKIFNKNTNFYSLLAGKKLDDIRTFFPLNKNIIRVMLNTSISVNSGTIAVYSLKRNLNKNDLFLLNILGNVHKLDNENFFDLITAIVGSGPAYFYYLLELMEKTAVSYGLRKKFAKEIIKETYIGTAKSLNILDGDFSDLKRKITSKGGTTEAAIKCLNKNNFNKVISNSIKESIKKAKILSFKK